MTGVIIAADEGDKKLWKTLPEILARCLPGSLMILGSHEAELLRPEEAIIISGGAQPVPECFHGRGGAVAVVDSGKAGAVERIGESGVPAITCGLSARDTLTLPSFAHDSAVLGIQRRVACFDGSVIEPEEIPLRLSGGIGSFLLMAAASVFLLTGNAEKLRSAVI